MSHRYFIPLLASGLFSTSIHAADLFVSPIGNDANKGTSSTAPLKTITMASKLSYPGDTINVAPGTYNENVKISKSGNSTDKIRFVSTTKWGAKIIGSGTEAMWTNNGSFVEINGFDISGPGRLGILNQGSYVLMTGNHIHNLKVSGGCTGAGGAGIVNGNYKASDGDIIGNVVHDIGIPGACNGVQGIYSSNLRGKILNNIVYRASSFGIHLWHGATSVTIANNTVFSNGSSTMGGGIVFGTGDAPGGVIMDNTKVINNIVFNNPGASISQYCYAGQDCIGPNNFVSNNLIYGNGKGVVLKKGSAINTISLDPQFVNFKADGTGDYHLTAVSPAIDKGLSVNAPKTDIDGRTRTSIVDIGAYEFVSETLPIEPKALASVNVTSLNFGNVLVGTKSAVKIVTISNTGNAPLLFPQGFTLTGKFAFGGLGTCKVNTNYAPGTSCTASVVFTPSASGLSQGSLNIQSNAQPVIVKLSGNGI